MLNIFKYLLVAIFLSFCCCKSHQNQEKRLQKKLDDFTASDFPFLDFERLYILQGKYSTKRNFEIIYPKLEIHRGSDDVNYSDFLIFHLDGTLDMFYDVDIKAAKLKITPQNRGSSGVLSKKDGKISIFSEQAFKGLKKLGISPSYGITKKELKIIDGKIYIQDGSTCSVYVLAS